MTDTATSESTKSGKGLSGMLLPELKQLASSMGITGASGMRKGDLVAAISAKQSGSGNGSAEPRQRSERKPREASDAGAATAGDKPSGSTQTAHADSNESGAKGNRNGNRDNGNRDSNRDGNRDNGNDRPYDDDEGGSRRRRRRGRDRFRDRRDRRPAGGNEQEVELSEDDVVVPVAGILDIL